jgi:hypothetical protein
MISTITSIKKMYIDAASQNEPIRTRVFTNGVTVYRSMRRPTGYAVKRKRKIRLAHTSISIDDSEGIASHSFIRM